MVASSSLTGTSTKQERLRIDSSGRLLVGTTSGSGNAKLQIQGGIDYSDAYLDLCFNGPIVSGQTLGELRFTDAASSANVYAKIAAQVDAAPGSGDYPGRLVFSTTADGASSPTERMRITSSGGVLIGKTAANASNAGTDINGLGFVGTSYSPSTNSSTCYDLYSTGVSAYRFYVGMGGTIYATNTTISAISDARYKENIVDLDSGLAKILELKPRKFDWKPGKGKDIKGDRGFIAQEFEQVFPDLVDEWRDPAPEGEESYKSVRQDLIPVLVKAIQEQQTMINELQAKVAALEAS
jgi:hypothetical protein